MVVCVKLWSQDHYLSFDSGDLMQPMVDAQHCKMMTVYLRLLLWGYFFQWRRTPIMGQLCLGSAARYPLPLSTQQFCVSVVPALVPSLCHLTSIVHSQSAESPQLPNSPISNLSPLPPLLSFCFLNPPRTITFAHKKSLFFSLKKKKSLFEVS